MDLVQLGNDNLGARRLQFRGNSFPSGSQLLAVAALRESEMEKKERGKKSGRRGVENGTYPRGIELNKNEFIVGGERVEVVAGGNCFVRTLNAIDKNGNRQRM